MALNAFNWIARNRGLAVVTGLALAGAALMAVPFVLAQDPPEYDPPLPTTMAEPPGKPEYLSTPTPDQVVAPSGHVCGRVPGLCSLAGALTAAHARGDLAEFTSRLSAVPVPCLNPESNARAPGALCAGQSNDARVSGFSILAKQAVVASDAEFTAFLSDRLGVPAGRGRSPLIASALTAGCSITKTDDVDCSVVAVTIGLRDPKTSALGDAVVLVYQRPSEGKFALVGAASGTIDGALVNGGPERRLVGGWTGNPTGDFYFEKLP